MTVVNGVSPYSNTRAVQSTSAESNRSQELGQDLFLQLLVTQLRYQDPLRGGTQDTGQMITQLTLFSLMEQLVKLQQTVERSEQLSENGRALGLLNRTVEVLDDQGQPVRGKVTAVNFYSSQPYLTIDGREFPLRKVVAVEGEE